MLTIILGIALIVWGLFSIAVMVAVLRVASEALPYYRRRNAEHRRQAQQVDREKHPWAYE